MSTRNRDSKCVNQIPVNEETTHRRKHLHRTQAENESLRRCVPGDAEAALHALHDSNGDSVTDGPVPIVLTVMLPYVPPTARRSAATGEPISAAKLPAMALPTPPPTGGTELVAGVAGATGRAGGSDVGLDAGATVPEGTSRPQPSYPPQGIVAVPAPEVKPFGLARART
jgi:hypothetical protein